MVRTRRRHAIALAVCGVTLLSLARAAEVVAIGSPEQAKARCGLHSLPSGQHCLCDPGAECKGSKCTVARYAGDHLPHSAAQAGFSHMHCIDCVCAPKTDPPVPEFLKSLDVVQRVRCEADGSWYSCASSRCHGHARPCASNPALLNCACPEPTPTQPGEAPRHSAANNATLATPTQKRCRVKPASARHGPLCEGSTTEAECVQLGPTCQWLHVPRTKWKISEAEQLAVFEHFAFANTTARTAARWLQTANTTFLMDTVNSVFPLIETRVDPRAGAQGAYPDGSNAGHGIHFANFFHAAHASSGSYCTGLNWEIVTGRDFDTFCGAALKAGDVGGASISTARDRPFKQLISMIDASNVTRGKRTVLLPGDSTAVNFQHAYGII